MTFRTPPYPADLASLRRDCEKDFFVASGPGGQHRNRSHTGVRLKHLPSGTVVTATERRSQSLNLQTAYERMAERLEELNRVPKRRRPTRPSRASREARLRDKQSRSRTKRQRRKPSPNGD